MIDGPMSNSICISMMQQMERALLSRRIAIRVVVGLVDRSMEDGGMVREMSIVVGLKRSIMLHAARGKCGIYNRGSASKLRGRTTWRLKKLDGPEEHNY